MNWQAALAQTLKEFESATCQWGADDCCQFVSRYWELMTGVSHAAKFNYESKQSAWRIVIEAGGTLLALFESLLGAPGNLTPGAVVLLAGDEEAEEYGPGIYVGYCVFTMDIDRGIVRTSPERILEAWPCPAQPQQ